MKGALTFSIIILRTSDDDLPIVLESEEFPMIWAWLYSFREDPTVAAALQRLIPGLEQSRSSNHIGTKQL